ncbi:MAG: hypothetical protein ACR2PL_17305 [Dehalococcoidia bacterium]
MVVLKRTIPVQLDEEMERRVEKAEGLLNQSREVFLQKAADDMARKILVDWAVARRHEGMQSFSELAAETGLAVEEIIEALAAHGRDEALAMYLASGRTVSATQRNSDFLRLAEEAVGLVLGS